MHCMIYCLQNTMHNICIIWEKNCSILGLDFSLELGNFPPGSFSFSSIGGKWAFEIDAARWTDEWNHLLGEVEEGYLEEGRAGSREEEERKRCSISSWNPSEIFPPLLRAFQGENRGLGAVFFCFAQRFGLVLPWFVPLSTVIKLQDYFLVFLRVKVL